MFTGDTENLEKEQLGRIFKSVPGEHRATPRVLADLAPALLSDPCDPCFEAGLAQIAYTLLAEQGLMRTSRQPYGGVWSTSGLALNARA